MHLNEYQTRALGTRTDPDIIQPAALWAMGLAGETGEVLEKIKKIFRDHDGEYTLGDATAIKKELGDVLWYMTALADSLGISLHDIAITNLAKVASRAERGCLQGDGDDR